MKVLVEGLEMPNQLARVVSCKLVQGYYCSRPLPTKAAAELLAIRNS